MSCRNDVKDNEADQKLELSRPEIQKDCLNFQMKVTVKQGDSSCWPVSNPIK